MTCQSFNHSMYAKYVWQVTDNKMDLMAICHFVLLEDQYCASDFEHYQNLEGRFAFTSSTSLGISPKHKLITYCAKIIEMRCQLMQPIRFDLWEGLL